jgi:hypothetical protein
MKIALALCLLGSPAGEEKRDVLCLYNSREDRSTRASEIQLYAEVVLNYLGLVATYRDVHDGLPDDAEMERYRGILVWFTEGRVRRTRDCWRWIARQAEAGRKVVLVGNLGATYATPPDVINEGLRPLGLTYRGLEVENPALIEIVRKEPLVEFERTLDRELGWYVCMKAAPPCRVHLRARRRDVPDSESDLVVTGPWGGFAWIHVHYDPRVNRDQWRINPFAFLAEAFGVERIPKMDLATAMGHRIFFASVDGDGLGNRVQPGPKTGRFSGEIVRDDFIRRIDLPITVSVIAADLEEHGELARSILSLPNVEPAAHGYYHPVSWPRRKLSYPGPFSLDLEVTEAVRRIERAAGKPVRAYLWTGDCEVPEEAIARCDALGIAHMNGPDQGRPQNHTSLTNLRAATLRRGSRVQFNHRGGSENQFTDLWTRNFFAYRNVLWSYERTETPYRVTPIHVYFHFYVVEQPGGEAALREIYDWVRRQEIFPMTVSEYVAWVRGFFSARLERIGDRTWRIRNYGACRTVRFDDESAEVDLSRSRNVLGFVRSGSTLYVHLAAAEEAVVALGRAPPGATWLVEANGDWRDGRIVARTAARATFMTPRGRVTLRAEGHEMPVDLR